MMDKALNKVIKSHVTLTVLSVVAVVLLMGGVSYSIFQIDRKNTTNQKIQVGTLDPSITSIEGGIVVSDLYPESSESITDDTKRYTFTIANNGTYNISYEVYLKDATDTLLASTAEYNEYKRIASDHYQYINYKLDGTTVKNLTDKQSGEKFVILKGTLKAGESEEHYLQFFLDNKETTTTGAPNEIAGSVISLDIYFDGEVLKDSVPNRIMMASNGTKDSFASTATTDEGIFEMEDDYGTSYYFSGAVENNYVKFGQNKSGQDMFWRIIRLNGDGSLRIIYDGTSAHANGEASEDRVAMTGVAWNTTNYNDAKYVGYMYGGENGVASTSKDQAQTNETSSNIKTELEKWYKDNIVDTGYSNTVSDEIFCNDRSTPGKTVTGWSSDTGLGYGTKDTAYGTIARYGWSGTAGYDNPKPQFTCPNKNDSFTESDTTKGNGALEYPVGLITADEIVAAGSGKWLTTNESYYLYKGTQYWSLSPRTFSNNLAGLFCVGNNGSLNSKRVVDTAGVDPVINLSVEYTRNLIGEGTIESPYRAA